MIQSMTGYGKADIEYNGKRIIVELRSLNSKQMDISTRILPQYRAKELDIRTMITKELEHGKVDCYIYNETSALNEKSNFTPINIEAFNYYRDILFANAKENHYDINQQDWLAAVMRIPEVVKPTEVNDVADEEWNVLQSVITNAIESFKQFRQQEGSALQKMFCEKLDGISQLLEQVEQYEGERVQKIRQRLEDNLSLLSEQTQQAVDKNRLEQEMIFYLEKLDVTEEKVRLRNHIKYFRETMNENVSVGKKLGFIAQEMGREINTLGSKSNHSEMQIIVVKMKDILEQIKEQVLNVL